MTVVICFRFLIRRNIDSWYICTCMLLKFDFSNVDFHVGQLKCLLYLIQIQKFLLLGFPNARLAIENKDFCDLYIVVDIIAFHFVLKIVIVVKCSTLSSSVMYAWKMTFFFLLARISSIFSPLTNSPVFEPRGLISLASPFPSHPRNALSLMLLHCSSSVQN